MAKRSYACLRSGAAAGKSYLLPEARGSSQEELHHAKSQGRWPRGATLRPRSSGCAGVGGPRSYSTFKVRRGSGEEIPLAQGKEQWLHFAGAAVKRYPTSKVRETQVSR